MKTKFKQAFMDCAITFSGLSSAVRAQVGSIIVKDNRIISIGYNGMPSGWDNECEDTLFSYDERVAHNPLDVREWTYDSTTKQYSALKTKPEVLHAEANAITKVAKSPESCEGAAIFCTHMPCIECAKLIHQCGITEVYYNNDYNASKGSGLRFLVDCDVYMEQV
jgi:dCMP deaminase|tara:strand:+ start:1144 stop:1638 length:495 start_codon:yes stop_codon:yes gene_type:complete